MAEFVVLLRFKPWEYWQLTVAERAAIIRAWNTHNRR